MSEKVLFRALVSQSARLIARVITLTNARPNLAHLHEDFFYELSKHLQTYGVPRRVAADMFGLAMRSYLRRIRKYSNDLDYREHQLSLWQIVYETISEKPGIQRQSLLDSFSFSQYDSVCSVLRHLCEVGLVVENKTNGHKCYNACRNNLTKISVDEVAQYIWAMVFMHGETTYPYSSLLREAGPLFGEDLVSSALNVLVEDGYIVQVDENGPSYSTVKNNLEQPFGWLVAVTIHIDSIFEAIVTKLSLLHEESQHQIDVRGGTWTFRLHHNHPFKKRIESLFDSYEKQIKELFVLVRTHNDSIATQHDDEEFQIDFYMGQGVRYLKTKTNN